MLFTHTSVNFVVVGAREQPLDWNTAPPVHVLSFLVLGSEKDAKAKEVGIVQEDHMTSQKIM